MSNNISTKDLQSFGKWSKRRKVEFVNNMTGFKFFINRETNEIRVLKGRFVAKVRMNVIKNEVLGFTKLSVKYTYGQAHNPNWRTKAYRPLEWEAGVLKLLYIEMVQECGFEFGYNEKFNYKWRDYDHDRDAIYSCDCDDCI